MPFFKDIVKGVLGTVGHAQPDKLENYLKFKQDEQKNTVPRTEYISALNADADAFSQDCRAYAARFGVNQRYTDLKYKHYVQSFPPEDCDLMTQEKCHALGVEAAKAFWGDFPVLVVSHFEPDEDSGQYHWHNHFLVYNCNVHDGSKLNTKRGIMREQKRYVAAQAQREGLTRRGLVLLSDGSLRESQSNAAAYNVGEKYIARRGQAELDAHNATLPPNEIERRTFLTQKAELRLAVSEAARRSRSFEDFKKYLAEVYAVKVKVTRGVISYLHPERINAPNGGWIRGRKLGAAYEKEAVLNAYEFTEREADLPGGREFRPEQRGIPADPSRSISGERFHGQYAAASDEKDANGLDGLLELYRAIYGGDASAASGDGGAASASVGGTERDVGRVREDAGGYQIDASKDVGGGGSGTEPDERNGEQLIP